MFGLRVVLWSPLALVLLMMAMSVIDASYLSIPLTGLINGREQEIEPILRGWVICSLVFSAVGVFAHDWIKSMGKDGAAAGRR